MTDPIVEDRAQIPLVFYRLAMAMLTLAHQIEDGAEWAPLIPNVNHAIYKLSLASTALLKGPEEG